MNNLIIAIVIKKYLLYGFNYRYIENYYFYFIFMDININFSYSPIYIKKFTIN